MADDMYSAMEKYQAYLHTEQAHPEVHVISWRRVPCGAM
jgi:hypothetical protein